MAPITINAVLISTLLASFAGVYSAPTLLSRPSHKSTLLLARADAELVKQNAITAQGLNAKFATMSESDSCDEGQTACVSDGFAQCVGGKWQVQACTSGLQCFALPLVNSEGTSLTCDTPEDAAARFENAGVSGGVDGSGTNSTSSGTDSSSAPAVSSTVVANNGGMASSTATSPAASGTQFITGACSSDADCASGCCGFHSGKCAGPVIAQERDGGCGFGDPQPNNRAAQAIQGPNAEAAPGVNNNGSGADSSAESGDDNGDDSGMDCGDDDSDDDAQDGSDASSASESVAASSAVVATGSEVTASVSATITPSATGFSSAPESSSTASAVNNAGAGTGAMPSVIKLNRRQSNVQLTTESALTPESSGVSASGSVISSIASVSSSAVGSAITSAAVSSVSGSVSGINNAATDGIQTVTTTVFIAVPGFTGTVTGSVATETGAQVSGVSESAISGAATQTAISSVATGIATDSQASTDVFGASATDSSTIPTGNVSASIVTATIASDSATSSAVTSSAAAEGETSSASEETASIQNGGFVFSTQTARPTFALGQRRSL